MRRGLFLAALALAAALLAAAGSRATTPRPTLQEMVGQLLLVRMEGRRPSQSFLGRIARGEIGGVILFGDNFGPGGPAQLDRTLQSAARAAGRPPLLIAVDQEGGIVKRLPGAPTLAPPEMTSAATAEAQGVATAQNLTRAGINTDLAPVLDVGHGGFITPRTFGGTPAAVATRGVAFSSGLARGHVLATAKHFPGLGRAKLSTDTSVDPVRAKRAQLMSDLAPFEAAIGARIPLVMVGTATYPSLGVDVPAACSPAIVRGLLRGTLGFRGVVVTDALKTPAVAHFYSPADAARRAIAAGVDLVLAAGPTPTYADTDGISTSTYDALLAAARSGQLSQTTIRAAYNRVLALKKRVSYQP